MAAASLSKYSSIVKEACLLLEKFRAGRKCLDDFLEDASKELQALDAPQRKLILDAVCGCVEHENMLDVVVKGFFVQHGRCWPKAAHSQFYVVCYLLMFALDDLGVQRFGGIVKSLDVKKMHIFISFFFSNLTTWIQSEWNHIYDVEFVETQWIERLLRWRPKINTLMDQLVAKLSPSSHFKKTAIKNTEPKEFSLTKPKPRFLRQPMPELVPKVDKCKPAPKSTFEPPKEQEMMEEIKQKNFQKAEERFCEANAKKFRCADQYKSERTKRMMAMIENDLNSQLKFDSRHSSGVPPRKKIDHPVKLNAAAVLRTEALLKRQLEEELQSVEQLAQGGGEPSSFLQWQQEMREKDRHEKPPGCRRLEARISDMKGALARFRSAEQKQKFVQMKRDETAQLMRSYAEKRLKEEKNVKDLVQAVAQSHKNSKAAREKIQKLKQSIAKEVSEESQALLRQALEDAQAEMSRKFEIIQEIHRIEMVTRNRVTNFDDTETPGHWLMDEMSLAELRLRLSRLKESQETEQQEKQRGIQEEKQKRKQLYQKRLENVKIHERLVAQAAAVRREERKAKQEPVEQTDDEKEMVLALKKELEERSQEYQRLKQTQHKNAKAARQPAAVHAGTVKQKSPEVLSWDEIEQSLTRYVQDMEACKPLPVSQGRQNRS